MYVSRLAEAFRSRGETALTDLHGRFAVAVVHPHTQEAWLATDRFGIQDLYVRADHHGIAWSTHLHALAGGTRLDTQALYDYVYFHCIPAPRTIYTGVYKLPAGHVLRWRPGHDPQLARYWRPDFAEDETPADTATLTEALRTLLRQAVERASHGAGTVGALGVVVFLRLYGERGLAAILRLGAPLIGDRSTRLDEIGKNFLSGLGGLCQVRVGVMFLSMTAILWGLELGVAALIASAFQLDIAAGNLLFVMIAITVGTLVPSSPGYLGTFEFFGLSTLAMVGQTGGNALSFVIVLHAVTILGAGFLGVLCLGRWPSSVVLQPAEARGTQE